MDYRMGIVANPNAGEGLKGFEPIRKIINRNRQLQLTVFYHITDNLTKLSEVVRKLINEKKIDVLGVYGGDGSLHKVMDICIYEFENGRIPYVPTFALLGGGTQKAVFQWLGWQSVLASILGKIPILSWLVRRKGNSFEIFSKLIRTPKAHLPLRSLRPLAIEFLNTKNEEAERETRYGFFFIMGAVNRVIELYDASGKSVLSGLGHAILGMVAALIGFPRSHAKLIKRFNARQAVDSTNLEADEPLSVICSVTESLLFGLKPFIKRAESNQFYCVTYSIPAWFLVVLLPMLARAIWVPKGSRFFNQAVMSLNLTPAVEGTFFVDGDFYSNRPGEPIQIALGPPIELIPYF